jgi:hypothetical protein
MVVLDSYEKTGQLVYSISLHCAPSPSKGGDPSASCSAKRRSQERYPARLSFVREDREVQWMRQSTSLGGGWEIYFSFFVEEEKDLSLSVNGKRGAAG